MGAVDRGAIAGLASPVTIPGDFLMSLINQGLPADRKLPLTSQALQDTLTQMGIAKPGSPAERVLEAGVSGIGAQGSTSAAGRLLANEAVTGVPAAIQAMPASTAQRVGQTLAQNPITQAAGASAAGIASQTAAEMGASAPVQFGAGVLGSMVGASGGRGPTIPLSAEEQAVQNANQVGGRLMTSDVFPPQGGGAQMLQQVGERVPIAGTGPVRAAQQRNRVQAIGDLLEEYGAGPAKEDFQQAYEATGADLLKSKQAALDSLNGQKREVIDRLSQPNVNGSGEISKVSVPVPNTTTAIDNQLAYLQGLRTADAAPVIAKLQDWKAAVQNQTLSNLDDLRKFSLGKAFTDPSLAASRDLGERVLSSIYGPLKQDMGDFIKNNGGQSDFEAWNSANAGLSNLAKDAQNTALKAALAKGDMKPSLVNRMLLSQDPADAQMLFKNLSPEGRANAQSAILSRAAQQAVTSGSDNISPEKFMTAVQKLGGPVGVFFPENDKLRIQGLVDYLNQTRRASAAGANVPTGIQTLIPNLSLGTAGYLGGASHDPMGGAIGALATLGTVGGLARIYESAPVRDLLIKYAKAKPEAKAYLFNRLNQVIQAEAGTESTQEKK
jgi:hypothetical protein